MVTEREVIHCRYRIAQFPMPVESDVLVLFLGEGGTEISQMVGGNSRRYFGYLTSLPQWEYPQNGTTIKLLGIVSGQLEQQ
jgi:hypothetical protein